MDRFDRFSDDARRTLTYAQDEALRLGQTSLTTEHLLLGLLRDRETTAVQVLVALNVEVDKVRIAVEFIIGSGSGLIPAEVGLTAGAKRSIELAIAEARSLDHHFIGTEHLLLGLIREREGIAAGVLESLGVDYSRARREVVRLAASDAGEARSPRSALPGAPASTASRRHDPSDFPDPGDTLRVIALKLAHESRQQRTEFVALDIRERGAILDWSVRSFAEDQPARAPLLHVTDDRSGTYAAANLDTDRVGQRLLGRTLVMPAPSPEAATLVVSILEVDEGSDPPAPATWHQMEIPLGG